MVKVFEGFWLGRQMDKVGPEEGAKDKEWQLTQLDDCLMITCDLIY